MTERFRLVTRSDFDGLVCGASSPVPAPLTVEGGMQAIVCVDPGG